MDTNNLFEDLKPNETSKDWEQSFFGRLEKQKGKSDKKVHLKGVIYFSFLLLNIIAIFYSFKTKKASLADDKYLVLSETLFSTNNY
jgi:hypothetical protein